MMYRSLRINVHLMVAVIYSDNSLSSCRQIVNFGSITGNLICDSFNSMTFSQNKQSVLPIIPWY